MTTKQLPEFLTAENDLDGQEPIYIAQGGKTRKTTLQKIKEFIIGTAALLTTDKTPTGAINELKDGVDNLTESVANNTTQLNEKANKTDVEGLQGVVKYGDNETTKILAPVSGVSIKNKNNTDFMSLYCSDVIFKTENRAIRGIGSDQLQIKSPGELRLLTDNPSGLIVSNVAGNAFVPIVASAFNVGSKEEFKTNIEEINADLDLLKNSKIYEYNLKNELEQGIEEKHYGFVIDRETPKEILSPSGDTVDIYSLVSLLWRQNQELLERITILENSVMELGNLINKEEVK